MVARVGGELRLRRPSRACGVAVECSIASMLKDRATQSVGPAVLQNDGFACTGVKSPMCENSDNMALLNPILMFNAFRARCTKRADSDCATANFGGARARVRNDSPSKVTSSPQLTEGRLRRLLLKAGCARMTG